MEALAETNSRSIRLAASLFFIFSIPMSLWETNYVHAKIFVPQNPVATANNLLANEFIFRTSIISYILGTIIFLFMILIFYRLFSPVDKFLSLFMIIPIMAQIPIVFVFETLNFTALMILKADARATFDVAQQQEVAYLLLRAHRYAFGADKIIFGLCFVPFGLLVTRSGFAPRFIGILMIIGGVGYVADTCLYILLQRADYLTVQSLKLYSSASYSVALLWFLIKGVRNPNAVSSQT